MIQRREGQPWNLFRFQGTITLLEVIVRSSTYFLAIYRLLVELEELLRERPPTPAAPTEPPSLVTTGIAQMGGLALLKQLQGPDPELPHVYESVLNHLDLVGHNASDLGLERTTDRLKRIREYLEPFKDRSPLDLMGDARLLHEIRVLRESLEDDLAKRIIFFPDLDKYREYYNKSFGDEVDKAFPDAARETRDAANCYVTENNTGCVFHCMRVAEYGLGALGKKLLPHQKMYEWGPMIRDLRKRIEDLNTSGKKKLTPSRQTLLDFYSEALDQCVYFKGIRDSAAHTRGRYEAADALKALRHIEEFMRALAKNGLKLPRTLPTG
jgi:hypothetical protein